MKNGKHIRDPIHGDIIIEEDELEVLDSKKIQRLRRISQLGLSNLVYPSATHSRFMHSIGVLHLVNKVSRKVGLSDKERKNHRVASILHDSGHGPFSHASEIVSEEHEFSHEEISCEIVNELEDKIPANPDRIKSLILGKDDQANLLAGEIDCDRMDYLKRDAHMSGLEHGDVDIGTIIESMHIVDNDIIVEQSAAQATANFLTARYFMTQSLYSHTASQIAEKMLAESLRKYVDEYSVRRMMEKDDYEMHTELMNMDDVGEVYRKAVEERDIYKLCNKIGIQNETKEKLKSFSDIDRQKYERIISEEAGVERNEVILDLPTIPSTEEFSQKIKYNGEIQQVSDCLPIVSSLEDEKWRAVSLSVYGPEDKKEKIGRVSSDVFEN